MRFDLGQIELRTLGLDLASNFLIAYTKTWTA